MSLSEVHELVEAGQRSSGKHSLVALRVWMIERSQELWSKWKDRSFGESRLENDSIERRSFIYYLSHSTFYILPTTKCLSKAKQGHQCR